MKCEISIGQSDTDLDDTLKFAQPEKPQSDARIWDK